MTENLKSTAITNLDAVPPVRATAGLGGAGHVQSIYGTVVPVTAATAGSTYRMVRLPTSCSIKHVILDFTGGGTITHFNMDITLYYSDQTLDEVGAASGDTGVVNSLSTTASLFASAIDLTTDSTVGTFYEMTNVSNNYKPSARNKQLWDAAGLSSDPGGFFDVTIVTVTNDNSFSAALTVGLEVQFVMPYV